MESFITFVSEKSTDFCSWGFPLTYLRYELSSGVLLNERKKKNHLSVILFWCLATSYSHRGKPPTTIGAKELNFRVRHGNGCDLFAIITKLFTH